MFRYVYSVLLLAITKPACDHIIRIITKNTDSKVEDSTLTITAQLQKLCAELQTRNAEDRCAGKTPDEQSDLVDELAKKIADTKLGMDISGLQEDIAELRKMVLESRAAAHKDALSLHDEHVQIYKARAR